MSLILSSLLASVPKLRHGFTNRSLSGAELARVELRTFLPRQTHGDQLFWAESPAPELRPEADAIATFSRSFPIGVQTADCVPLLFVVLDENAQPFSVLAVHAGWRGSAKGIAAKAFSAWISKCRQEHRVRAVYAVIGPSISAKAYEVGSEVAQAFPQNYLVASKNPEKFMLDLPRYNSDEVLKIADELGVRIEIDDLEACTFSHPELYPSFRRDGARRSGGKPDRIVAFLELEP
jgi:YfiH family protein